jgi:hypothetical protein
MKTKFGPGGLQMNVEFEGGIMLSPLYDVEVDRQRIRQAQKKKEEMNHEKGKRSSQGVGREDEGGAGEEVRRQGQVQGEGVQAEEGPASPQGLGGGEVVGREDGASQQGASQGGSRP